MTSAPRKMKTRFTTVPILQTLLALLIAQAPMAGHCASERDGQSFFMHLFDSKGKDMKQVATKIATLDEDNDIWGLDFSPDGKHLAATALFGLKVNIWDWQKSQIVRTLMKPRGAGASTATELLQYSPDGQLLAACYGRVGPNDNYSVARIWNVVTGEIVHDIGEPVGGGACDAIGFSPDGKTFIRVVWRHSAFPGDNVIVYATDTWQPVWGLRTIPFLPKTLAISPDGKVIAVGGQVIDGPDKPIQPRIVIVDIAKRAIVRTIDAFPVENEIGHLAWNPDGIHLAAGARVGGSFAGPDAVKVFDARTGEQVVAEQATNATVHGLRYTKDGKYLIEAGVGTTIKIWDGQHRELLQEIKGDAGSLAVSRDGRYLAMGGDRKILVWELK
jgi:WD40 repeat protein